MKTSLKFMTVAIVSAAFSIASNMAMAEDTVKTIDGLKFQSCGVSEYGVNFCTKETADKLKAYANAKEVPLFGNDSALLRMWDKEMNYNVYAAINKKTNKVFFYPRGLRGIEGESRTPKLTFDNNNSICSAGDNVALVGDRYTQAFNDQEKDVDYCVEYSDDEGFGLTKEVDAETREVLDTLPI